MPKIIQNQQINFLQKIQNSWMYSSWYIYRVIHKSLWDFRPLRYSRRDGHAQGEHVNRGRDTLSFCPTLQVLGMSFLLCLSWLLGSRVRKFWRDI